MQDTTVGNLVKWCGGELVSGEPNTVVTALCTDSRKIEPGSVFVALRGENFDGHQFLQTAAESGAHALVGETGPEGPCGAAFIRVGDTRTALLRIAAGYREQFSIPLVGVTGSVGKTTTKEMIASVLSQKYNCLKTEGNFNTEIGLPLTLLRLDDTHGAGVVEMGMSGFGEISRLTRAAQPQIAVISNIGMSHIGQLGSQENILKAKLEILEGLQPGGLLVLNMDDKLLQGVKSDFETCWYGIAEDGLTALYMTGNAWGVFASEVHTDAGSCSFQLHLPDGKGYPVTLPLAGRHNVYNALAAAGCGWRLGVPGEDIVAGLSQAQNVGLRMQAEQVGEMTLLVDCYNASPDSMRAALLVLKGTPAARRIAVLGDMLEMGRFSRDAHAAVGQFAAENGADVLICIGEHAGDLADGARLAGVSEAYSFSKKEEAKGFLNGYMKPGDCLLVKGSRGMRMEEICAYIRSAAR